MNNAITLVPSDQIIVAYSDGEIITRQISYALFYTNSRLLAMHLYVDKSFATAVPSYAENFYTLMQWEMEQLDVNEVLMDIKALPLSVNSTTSDEYDIACMSDYFNAWWKENLGSCRVPDMLPKSSVQDVMELVEGHFSELMSP
ncbi:hypothetical protein BDR06DRAFT_1002300 [Suillus hirtellus]|nr:hypothetical protein BDR06DRAFT_1002300 [Suillus hirtellus]